MQDDDPEEPPGAVSDQNAEEAEAEHGEGDDGLRRRDPDPDEEEHEGGEAGEGSQSTGHPEGAG
jgi:hypothetical protein